MIAREALRAVIAGSCHVPLCEAHDEARLVSDLKLDSLEMLYLLMAIDSHVNARLDSHHVSGLRTVGDLITAVLATVGEPEAL